jgi:hypothetical protein
VPILNQQLPSNNTSTLNKIHPTNDTTFAMPPLLPPPGNNIANNLFLCLGAIISWIHLGRFFYLLNKASNAGSSTPSYEAPFHVLIASTIYLFMLPWDKILQRMFFPENPWSIDLLLMFWIVVLVVIETAFMLALYGPYWIWYKRAEEQFWQRKLDARPDLRIETMKELAGIMLDDNRQRLTVWEKLDGFDDLEVLEVRFASVA